MASMSPRERILAALKRQPVDYVPCSPNFNPLRPVQMEKTPLTKGKPARCKLSSSLTTG